MEKLRKVMQNVMAALNTGGVEYSTSIVGFDHKRDKQDLEEKGETIAYKDDEGFASKFDEFANIPQYSKIAGTYWADDEDSVLIQFSRFYKITAENWEKYAVEFGCKDADEEFSYGELRSTSRIYLNVRVNKRELDFFLKEYAHYCWGNERKL